MTKYYTIKECFDECGDDDIPFIERQFNLDKNMTKNEITNFCAPPFHYADIESDKWQIKRAEPKVLSADELYDSLISRGKEDRPWTNDEVVDAIDKSDKNGQNREWLRPEQVELREAVEIYCRNGECEETFHRLHNALENLKPPYEK